MRRSVIARHRHIASSLLRPVATKQQPFDQTLEEHKKSGVDAAETVMNDFIAVQNRLIWYRISRCAEEIQALKANPGAAFSSPLNVILHVALLAVLYFVGFVIGRGTLRPLVTVPAETTS